MKSFEPNELIQLRTSLMTDNNKNNDIKTDEMDENQSFMMDWMKICECVSHEMWPKLSSIIKAIIRQKNIDVFKINNKNIKKIIDCLKTRNIEIAAIKYLEKLIKRAITFIPTYNNNVTN
eukprot:73111_1